MGSLESTRHADQHPPGPSALGVSCPGPSLVVFWGESKFIARKPVATGGYPQYTLHTKGYQYVCSTHDTAAEG